MRRLDPRIKIIWLAPVAAALLFIWLLAAAAVFFIEEDGQVLGMGPISFAVFSFLGLLVFIFTPMLAYYSLCYDNYGYDITDGAVVITNGIFSKNEISIPLAHVSRVEVSRSIPERLLGIMTVEIVTPGPYESGVDHFIPGIPGNSDLPGEVEARKKKTGQARAPWDGTGAPISSDREVMLQLLSEMRQLNRSMGNFLSVLRAPPGKK
jgi:uncharacterized membrane protein YdbT with pleckstrin-like domain